MKSIYTVENAYGKNKFKVVFMRDVRKSKNGHSYYIVSQKYFSSVIDASDYAGKCNDKLLAKRELFTDSRSRP